MANGYWINYRTRQSMATRNSKTWQEERADVIARIKMQAKTIGKAPVKNVQYLFDGLIKIFENGDHDDCRKEGK